MNRNRADMFSTDGVEEELILPPSSPPNRISDSESASGGPGSPPYIVRYNVNPELDANNGGSQNTIIVFEGDFIDEIIQPEDVYDLATVLRILNAKGKLRFQSLSFVVSVTERRVLETEKAALEETMRKKYTSVVRDKQEKLKRDIREELMEIFSDLQTEIFEMRLQPLIQSRLLDNVREARKKADITAVNASWDHAAEMKALKRTFHAELKKMWASRKAEVAALKKSKETEISGDVANRIISISRALSEGGFVENGLVKGKHLKPLMDAMLPIAIPEESESAEAASQWLKQTANLSSAAATSHGDDIKGTTTNAHGLDDSNDGDDEMDLEEGEFIDNEMEEDDAAVDYDADSTYIGELEYEWDPTRSQMVDHPLPAMNSSPPRLRPTRLPKARSSGRKTTSAHEVGFVVPSKRNNEPDTDHSGGASGASHKRARGSNGMEV